MPALPPSKSLPNITAPADPTPENVRVAVRVRPFIGKERRDPREPSCLTVHTAEKQVAWAGKDTSARAVMEAREGLTTRAFTYDHVFDERSTQAEVYDEACAPLVAGCMAGYNATVFAYGQTGSGKTYTMGSGDGAGNGVNDGVIPRMVDGLFDALAAKAEEATSRVRVSYLEIYNEEVKDLLHPKTPSKSISIREDAAGGIFVLGVQERAVSSRAELFAALAAGSSFRQTGETLMNAHSSRSHSLFSVIVEQTPKAKGEMKSCAKLHLVDLAGSERNKKTGTVGARFKESVTINQGLLALGNVIAALCDENRNKGSGRRESMTHVPYRESKLTRLLQDSLGGNTQTLMIACVGPSTDNMDESLNTLRYADRAKHIKNKPVRNIDHASVVDLRGEIAMLQEQLSQMRIQVGSQPIPTGGGEKLPRSPTTAKAQQQQQPALAWSPGRKATQNAEEALPRVMTAATMKKLSKLRHTLEQWGRVEVQRAHLLQSIEDNPTSTWGGGGGGTEESRNGPLNVLKKAAERGVMLQARGIQQLTELEIELSGLTPAEAAAAALAGGTLSSMVRPGSAPSSRPTSLNGSLNASLDRDQGLLDAIRERKRWPENKGVGDSAVDVSALDAAPPPQPPSPPQPPLQSEEVSRLIVELSARDQTNATLTNELSEARADLLRDETIFAEKMTELRTLKKAYGSLQLEYEQLAAQLAARQANSPNLPPAPPPTAAPPGERLAAAQAMPSKIPLPGRSPSNHSTPASVASTRSVPQNGSSGPNSRSPPYGSGGSAANACPAATSFGHAGRLSCSPTRAFADELEANDSVLGGEEVEVIDPLENSVPFNTRAVDALRASGEAQIAELQRSIAELHAQQEAMQHRDRTEVANLRAWAFAARPGGDRVTPMRVTKAALKELSPDELAKRHAQAKAGVAHIGGGGFQQRL